MGRLNRTVKLILLSGIFVFIVVLYLNIQVMLEEDILEFLIYAGVSFSIIYLLISIIRIPSKVFIPVLFITSFVMKVMVAAYLKTEPISDFSLFWSAAQQIAEGEREYLQWGYFDIWAYQTGIITYYAAIIKLFGANLMAAHYVNSIWVAVTNVLIYMVAKRIANEKAAQTVALLYLIYPEPYFLCSTLSNQMLGDCLVFVAAYLFIRKTTYKTLIGIGAVGALANAVRPSGIVLMAAIMCILMLKVFVYESETSPWMPRFIQLGKGIAAAGIPYLLMGIVLSSMVKYSGLNPSGLKNNFPLYKFVVGVNLDTKGGYSDEDAKLTEITNKKQRNAISLRLISQRLVVGPSHIGNLFHMKLKNMWAGFDTLAWSFGRLEGTNVSFGSINLPYTSFSKSVLRYEKAFYVIIICMAMIGCMVCLRKRAVSIAYLTPLLLFLLYFAMQLLIEIQSRYRYFALISIFMLASKAFEILPLTNREGSEERI